MSMFDMNENENIESLSYIMEIDESEMFNKPADVGATSFAFGLIDPNNDNDQSYSEFESWCT